MVRRLDLEAHLLQRIDDRAPRLLAQVHRCQVEIAPHVVCRRARRAVGTQAEHEELRLHPGKHRVPQPGRTLHLPLEHEARVAGERLPLRRGDVADQARHAGLRVAPWEDAEGVEFGTQQHVALFHAHETLDRRPVEQDVAGQRLLQLGNRDLDILVDTEDVGELQADKANAVPIGELEQILGGHTSQVAEQGAGRSSHERRRRGSRSRGFVAFLPEL